MNNFKRLLEASFLTRTINKFVDKFEVPPGVNSRELLNISDLKNGKSYVLIDHTGNESKIVKFLKMKGKNKAIVNYNGTDILVKMFDNYGLIFPGEVDHWVIIK